MVGLEGKALVEMESEEEFRDEIDARIGKLTLEQLRILVDGINSIYAIK